MKKGRSLSSLFIYPGLCLSGHELQQRIGEPLMRVLRHLDKKHGFDQFNFHDQESAIDFDAIDTGV